MGGGGGGGGGQVLLVRLSQTPTCSVSVSES